MSDRGGDGGCLAAQPANDALGVLGPGEVKHGDVVLVGDAKRLRFRRRGGLAR